MATRTAAPTGAGKQKDPAYNLIREWIFEDIVPPGTRLSERAIAERLGVSRVPVREALQRMMVEGMVTVIPRKGICLRTYNEQDIYDLYVFREALDGMAARYFSIRSERMEIEYLKMIYQEMERVAADWDQRYWEEKDIEFHQIIARGSRNARIIKHHESVMYECTYLNSVFGGRVRETTAGEVSPHLVAVLKEHRLIIEAIESKNPDHAEAVARSSIQDGLERLMKSFIESSRQRPERYSE